MKIRRFLNLLMMAFSFSLLSHAQAEDHLGAPVYLASLHELDGRSVAHWKYNIARPEFVEVQVLDSDKQPVATVKRPTRQVDVTGRKGPFHLVVRNAAGDDIVIPVVGLEPAKHFAVPSLSRIGITQIDGKAQFVEKSSGKIFHPMGMNYVPLRHGDHAAFEAKTLLHEGFYDPLEVESVMHLLRSAGYNTVRVFVVGRRVNNPGLGGNPDTLGVYTPYLDNLADFLKRSANHGIYTVINFCDVDIPRNSYFTDKIGGSHGTDALFRTEGVTAFKEMVVSSLSYLKAKNPDLLKVILGVQFNNEVDAKLTKWPFTEKGIVKTANGKNYDISTLEDRRLCYEEGLMFYYEQLSAGVKSVDKDLLTCEGVFVAAAVGRDHRLGAATFDPDNLAKGFDWERGAGLRVPPSIPLLVKAPLDFIDIHLYPPGPLANFEAEIEDLLGSSLFKDAVALGAISEKPLILGEFGSFKKFVERDTKDGLIGGWKRWSRARELACTRHGFVGYLGWSLETFDQKDIFQALAFGPDFLRKFREEFVWPPSEPFQASDPAAVAALPIVLKDVQPTGAGKGFLIPQTLSN